MSEKIIAFLPCRKGSERVKEKNTRPFAGNKHGLIEVKLQQLMRCPDIAEIIVSSDDPVVRTLAKKASKRTDKLVHVLDRPERLARSDTSTDDLIQYIPEIVEDGNVLWTHVTAPFVDERVYSHAVKLFLSLSEKGENDSLMSVTRLQTFIWNQDGSLNYDRKKEKWPRTQTLPLWYEINSAIFLAPITVYKDLLDRVGESPHLYEIDFPESLDIDTENQFKLAEKVWNHVKKD